MTLSPFYKSIAIHIAIALIALFIAIPLLYTQVKDVIFELNLSKNREQAERLATLASIDLERGELPEMVLNKIQHMLENTPQTSEHFACIVEDENRVIAHPNPTNVNKDVTGWTLQNKVETKTYTQSAGEGVPFGGIQTRLDGSQDVTFQIPISTKPWSVAVHTKLDLVEEQAVAILKKIAWILLPVLLIFILISAYISTKKKTA